MKRLLTIFTTLIVVSSVAGQEIKENQVDEFTKNKVIRTSWEQFCWSKNIYAHARASRINDEMYIDLKLMFMKIDIFSIKEGAEIMLKLDNDSIISLKTPKYQISCHGCGAVGLIGSDGYGVTLSIPVDELTIKDLIPHKVVKLRIYTTDGYVESDIKEKYQDIITKELHLLNN